MTPAIPLDNNIRDINLESILENSHRFGLKKEEAWEIWSEVVIGVSQWKEVFADCGVLGSDIDYLSEFIDTEERLALRESQPLRKLKI